MIIIQQYSQRDPDAVVEVKQKCHKPVAKEYEELGEEEDYG